MTERKSPLAASAAPYFDRWDELYKKAYEAVVHGTESDIVGCAGVSKDEALEYAADFFTAAGIEFIRWVQENYIPGGQALGIESELEVFDTLRRSEMTEQDVGRALAHSSVLSAIFELGRQHGRGEG